MAKSRPIRILGGEGTTIDSLFERIPDAAKSNWTNDLAQLKRWYDDGFVNQCMNYPAIFWPCFVECNGCIVFDQRALGIDIWLEQSQGNRLAVETELNDFYIGDAFTGYPANPTRDQVIWMARLLKKMWLWKLTQAFPHRNFVVAFDEGADDVLRAHITFYQESAK